MSNRSPSVSLAPDVVLQVIDGEALLLKLNDEAVFALNGTGARIAQLIAEGKPVEAMVRILSSEYGRLGSDVDKDVSRLVDELCARGLATLVHGDGNR